MKPEFLIETVDIENDDLHLDILKRENAPDHKSIYGTIKLDIVANGNFSEYLKEDNTLDTIKISRDIHAGKIILTTINS